MSQPRKVYAMFANKLKTGEKQAILVPCVMSDQYKLEKDTVWQPSGDLPINSMVAAVKHMGRYETAIGNILAVYDDVTWTFMVHVRVRGIYTIKNRNLSAEQVKAMGFPSMEAYQADDNVPGGAGWLLDVELEQES